MRTYTLTANEPFPTSVTAGAVSVGNFDGVHKGHASLIAALRKMARKLGGPAVAVTFDPHPLRLLAPERFMPQLTTAEDRAEYLLAAGADRVVILKATKELLAKSAKEFLDSVMRDRLKPKAIVEGFNFAFGRDRQGNIDTLRSWCEAAGVELQVIEALRTAEGDAVSSSRVRTALEAGDVRGAADLLSRPYRLRGTVTRGDDRGASLGFPTANLSDCPTVIPGDGVYAVRAHGEFGSRSAAVNIGPNPTFGQNNRKVEAHLLDFTGGLYGQPLALDFIARLRDTTKFASKEALVAQLQQDVEQARKITV